MVRKSLNEEAYSIDDDGVWIANLIVYSFLFILFLIMFLEKIYPMILYYLSLL